MTTKPINLICLPFAGGNRYSYREYELKSPPFIKILTIEYPGRGARLREPLIRDMDRIVADLYGQLKKEDLNDYAIYGHSMGGLAAYLLTRYIMHKGHKPPHHLFISGTTGPSAAGRSGRKRHLLGKKEFLQEINDLDGMPDEILKNEELMEYFEPILRADFTATETYSHKESSPLNIPVTVITGTEEKMETEDIRSWQKETTRLVDFRQFPGKHFFIFQHTIAMMAILSEKLSINTKIYQS
jgi:surfactin synthase thioesterase subunit